MTFPERKQALRILGVLLLGSFAAAPFRAQSEDVQQTVARISFLTGSVSYARGDDPDNWQPADFNVPMTIGDRLYTGDGGRAELQVHGGFYIRIGAQADLAALNLTDDIKQWSLSSGTAAFRIGRLDDNEIFEVDTPNAAITFERTGQYRVDVDRDGNTRVAVLKGQALVASGGGQVPLNAGDEMSIDGTDSPRYDVGALRAPDSFDAWVRDRERRSEGARSHQYVHADIVGVADLDDYGRWQSIPQYGFAWTPSAVASGWLPYRDGHWIWQDPWGWSWVASERWGWAPYHYGRWIQSSSRWWWVPVARTERFVRYAPALVAFAGGGPGWSASVTVAGGGFIGWFPLAPRDPFVRWWGPRAGYGGAANVTYVNQTYITVVNHNTFVSGGVVTTNWVRDQSVVSSVMRAPVLRGPLPIVPVPDSLHAATRPGLPAPIRPPQAVLSRSIVVHSPPPPPPPSFRAKVEVIRRDRGAPIAPESAARIVETDRGAARPTNTVRPVAADSGRVTLAPKREGGKAPQPQPVAPARGRQPAKGGSSPVAQPSQLQPSPSQPSSGVAPVPDRGRKQEPTRVVTAVPAPAPEKSSQPAPNQRGRRPEPVIARSTPAPAPTAAPAPERSSQPAPNQRGKRFEPVIAPTPAPARAPEPTQKQPEPQNRQRDNAARQPQVRQPDVSRPTPAARPTPAPATEERGRRENPQSQRQQPPQATAPPREAPKQPASQPAAERGVPQRAKPDGKPPKPTPTEKPKN